MCLRSLGIVRPQLMRFARAQLRNDAWSEDAVSETLLAALEKPQAFAGRSQLKTWLVGILKHKIVDLVRSRVGFDSLDEDSDDSAALAIACPQPQPDEVATQREALRQTLARIEALPANLREVVELRVLQDQPTEAVCEALSISEDNLFVRLHRARKQLVS